MDKVFGVIKRHPYLFAGAVGVLVLYFIISGRSSSQTPASTPYNVQQDPNVIAAQAGLAGTQIQANAATTEASLQAGVLGQAITSQTSLQQSQTQALLGIAQAQFGAETNVAQIQATGAVNLANAVGAAQLALQENQNSSNFAIAQLELPLLQTQALTPIVLGELSALASVFGGGDGGGTNSAGGFTAVNMETGLGSTGPQGMGLFGSGSFGPHTVAAYATPNVVAIPGVGYFEGPLATFAGLFNNIIGQTQGLHPVRQDITARPINATGELSYLNTGPGLR